MVGTEGGKRVGVVKRGRRGEKIQESDNSDTAVLWGIASGFNLGYTLGLQRGEKVEGKTRRQEMERKRGKENE